MNTQKNNLSTALVVFAGFAVVACVMGFLIFQIAIANTRSTESRITNEIDALEQQLKRTDLGSEERKSLEAKLQALYYQSTLAAEGIRQLTEMPTQAEIARKMMANPTLIVDEERMTGIIENPPVPFSRSKYIINNAWQELVDGRYVIVYAGSLTKDPTQGVLLVYVDSDHSISEYLTPNKSGPLRISKVEGFRLVLQTENKSELYFDVPGFAFTNSLVSTVIPKTPSVAPIAQTPIPPYPPP
jgi:hypothetical protein